MRSHRLWLAGIALVAAAVVELPALGTDGTAAPYVPAGFVELVGPMHEHSGYSDGYPSSTPADYYESAKQFGNDFLMSGEHSDTLDAPLVVNEECAGPGVVGCPIADPEHPERSLRKWDAMDLYAKQATTDTFTGVRGFEWTSDRFNHIDVYFSRNYTGAKADGGYATMASFYRWLTTRPELGGGGDGLATFNHPSVKRLQGVGSSDPGRDWDDFAYVPAADRQMVGIEVYNDTDHLGRHYTRALDKGWHVGAIGAEDLGHKRGDTWGGPDYAKTVLFARDRSPAALREALLARRFYAIRRPDTRLAFTVDGAVMGARLPRAIGDEVTISASARRDARTGLRLEVVTAGNTVVAAGTDTLSTTLTVSAAQPYYFLRVLDGTGENSDVA